MLVINRVRGELNRGHTLDEMAIPAIRHDATFPFVCRGLLRALQGSTTVYNVTSITPAMASAKVSARTWDDPLPRAIPEASVWLEINAEGRQGGYLVTEIDKPTAYELLVTGFQYNPSNRMMGMIPAAVITFTSRQGVYKSVGGIDLTNELRDTAATAAALVGTFATLLHCRNIETRTWEPDEQTLRRHRRAGNLPPVSYKTLLLKVPETLQPRGPGNGEPAEDCRTRFHLCRGHFKNLTHPRYKTPGLHWWPAHWRGDADAGVIEKDYKLVPAT